MKNILIILALVITLGACTKTDLPEGQPEFPSTANPDLAEMAGILASLPLGVEQFAEVHDAACSSSGNGYDEEYMMRDLFSSPGSGVGDKGVKSSQKGYSKPLKDLLEDYARQKYASKAGDMSAAEAWIRSVAESDMQIYWPASEKWDGITAPIITFDPGYGAESNYGYRLRKTEDGTIATDTVYVDENVAMSHPVWVVNRNDDSAFSPLELFLPTKAPKDYASARRPLLLKSFTMLRNYDSWFGGASEFWCKIGAVDGFKAADDADLKNYRPSVTDFMIVVKRSDLGKELFYDAIMLSDLTSQMENVAFLITEDDGGTSTSWKCSASVKIQSKSYGFDIDIPYKDKDDLVWRGQLNSSFFQSEDLVSGRFGDVIVKFALE